MVAVSSVAQFTTAGVAQAASEVAGRVSLISVDRDQDHPATAAISYDDVMRLEQQRIEGVAAVRPLITAFVFLQSSYGETRAFISNGVSDTPPSSSPGDAIISQNIATALFPNHRATGGMISVVGNNVRLRIRSVVEPDTFGGTITDASGYRTVTLDAATLHRVRPGPVRAVEVIPLNGVAPTVANSAVIHELQRIHGKGAQYVATDPAQQLKTIGQLVTVVRAGLSIAAAASLLVAALCIANALLVSLEDRRKEIAVRRAVGARSIDIVYLFLAESIGYAAVGGLAGLVIGSAVAIQSRAVLMHYLPVGNVSFVPPIVACIISAVTIAIMAGVIPARIASKTEPLSELNR